MEKVKCAECGHKMMLHTPACPKCGADNAKYKKPPSRLSDKDKALLQHDAERAQLNHVDFAPALERHHQVQLAREKEWRKLKQQSQIQPIVPLVKKAPKPEPKPEPEPKPASKPVPKPKAPPAPATLDEVVAQLQALNKQMLELRQNKQPTVVAGLDIDYPDLIVTLIKIAIAAIPAAIVVTILFSVFTGFIAALTMSLV